jgi:hypothetical protein
LRLGLRLALDDRGARARCVRRRRLKTRRPGDPRRCRLLHYMRQLVGNQSPSLVRCRRIPARAERNVVPYGVGMGIDVSR